MRLDFVKKIVEHHMGCGFRTEHRQQDHRSDPHWKMRPPIHKNRLQRAALNLAFIFTH
jgi:hypothetical protein